MNKFTDYDMRKFTIKDTRDIYAFFDAVKKGMEQTERIVKKLNMSQAAQASVIRSFKANQAQTQEVIAAADEPIATVVQESGVSQAKESIIQKLRSAANAEPDVTPSRSDESAQVSEEPEESPSEEELEALATEISDSSDEQSPDDAPEVSKNDVVVFEGYTKRRFSNGQMRYFIDDGVMVKGSEVPAHIKEELDKQL